MVSAERLGEIRRGDGSAIEVITTDGHVVLLYCHGLNIDEQLRTRERAMRLLADALRDAPMSHAS